MLLSGANWGPFVPPFALRQEIPTRSVGKGIGHFFGALRIDGFIDPDEFKRQIDEWIRVFRATKPAPGSRPASHPRRPRTRGRGDPVETRHSPRARRRDDLRDIAAQTGIPFDANPVRA